MSRPLRLEFAGAFYHVTSRGDRRDDIYHDYDDRNLAGHAGALVRAFQLDNSCVVLDVASVPLESKGPASNIFDAEQLGVAES